jgi:hypothetical protein
MLFHVILNAPSSKIQMITLLKSKKFQILDGGRYIQKEQLSFLEEFEIPIRGLIKNLGSQTMLKFGFNFKGVQTFEEAFHKFTKILS